MSDTLTEKVGALTTEVQKSQGLLVQGIAALDSHQNDPEAHDIDVPGSPFRTAVENVAVNALVDGDPSATIQKVITSKVTSAINTTLPAVLDQQLQNPVSNLSATVNEQISNLVEQKIKDGALGDAVNSSVADAKATADTALSKANEAKSAAENALPKNGTAAAATKLATARNLLVDLASTASASFDGTVNADIGVKGTLAVARGGTGATTAQAALANLGGVPRSGDRGSLAGSETAVSLSGSQTITANSADAMNISLSGPATLTFTPAAANVHAVKSICLTATAAVTLTVSGAEWANNGSAPTWGSAGKRLILIAHFVAGVVVLSIADNNEL